MCVHIIVTFTNNLFTFYTLIYIDYIFFSKYISSEMWLSSHTQACGFFGVPGMALIQSEINRPQVVAAKCSEPQADTIKVGVKEVV